MKYEISPFASDEEKLLEISETLESIKDALAEVVFDMEDDGKDVSTLDDAMAALELDTPINMIYTRTIRDEIGIHISLRNASAYVSRQCMRPVYRGRACTILSFDRVHRNLRYRSFLPGQLCDSAGSSMERQNRSVQTGI